MRYLVAGILLCLIFLTSYTMPPGNFPSGKPVGIESGLSNRQIANKLEELGVIKSATAFVVISRLSSEANSLYAGTYLFEKPLPLWNLIDRISSGSYGTTVRKVTIPEGSTNTEISTLAGLDVGDSDQGYLFPDTYYIDQFATAEEVRKLMRDNFDIKVSATTTSDTIILASILEGEVKTDEDRRLVAGIMFKRLQKGMPLQVDAAPSTYEHTGLPSYPINNPGLEAIRAAENPTESAFLYYISDKQGVIHYARTFDEHKANRLKYKI